MPDVATLDRQERAPKQKASGSSDRRSCTKLVRFTNEELERVQARARASGRPVACYIRETALGGRTRATHSPTTDRVLRELARVGTRLRALSTSAAESGLPGASAFEAALVDVLALIQEIG